MKNPPPLPPTPPTLPPPAEPPSAPAVPPLLVAQEPAPPANVTPDFPVPDPPPLAVPLMAPRGPSVPGGGKSMPAAPSGGHSAAAASGGHSAAAASGGHSAAAASGGHSAAAARPPSPEQIYDQRIVVSMHMMTLPTDRNSTFPLCSGTNIFISKEKNGKPMR
jgi:hypothetical protein